MRNEIDSFDEESYQVGILVLSLICAACAIGLLALAVAALHMFGLIP